MTDTFTIEELDLILQALGYQKQAFAEYKTIRPMSLNRLKSQGLRM
jgi:hypothetical protein